MGDNTQKDVIELRNSFSRKERSIRLIAMISLLAYPSVHELGHYIIARLDGAEIFEWSFLPNHRGTTLVSGYVMVDYLSFSSITMLILFKLAGFLFTFFPSALTVSYLWKKTSLWWHIPFMWVMAAPGAAFHDFLDLGSIYLRVAIGRTISFFAALSTCFMLTWYVHRTFITHPTYRRKVRPILP